MADKPFSKDYVVRTTLRHMRKNVDVGIQRTVQRIEEFSEDLEVSREIFETLTILQGMRNQIETQLSKQS